MAQFETSTWSSPESKLSAEDFAKVCLMNWNGKGELTKGKMALPVRKTPGGAINTNAVHAAAAALAGARGGVKAPPAEKKAAAKKLISYYGEMKETPPDSLKRVAGA